MANRTVRLNCPGSFDYGSLLLGVVKPVGLFEITAVRYYCTTVDEPFCYCDVSIHGLNTNWDWGDTPYGEGGGALTIKYEEASIGYAKNYVIADGAALEVAPYTGRAFTANHVIDPAIVGRILHQVDKTTAEVTTKTIAGVGTPPPDANNVALGYNSQLGPWTANTNVAPANRAKLSKRGNGTTNVIGCLNDYAYFAAGITRNDSLSGAPYTEGDGATECIVFTLAPNDPTVMTGAWVEVDFTDEQDDSIVARGEGRASVTVTSPSPPTIGAGTRADSRAVVLLDGAGGITASSRGEARTQALEGVAQVTTFKVQLVGQNTEPEARVTALQTQMAGYQDPEGTEARTTHLHTQQAGIQNPEDRQAKVTHLSVQMLRVRGAPDLPLPPVRLPGCTMYNVIRAGEEESGQNATRGTYRRLSGDIFLYRRELLQRLRMAYFDAEDYRFTLTVPQGLP